MGGWAVSWSDVPGHVSYVLIALSYWMTNVFWLRIIAVIGLVFEIFYFRMSSGDMHTGIGWDAIFIIINLYQIFRLVYDERRLRYMVTAAELAIYQLGRPLPMPMCQG